MKEGKLRLGVDGFVWALCRQLCWACCALALWENLRIWAKENQRVGPEKQTCVQCLLRRKITSSMLEEKKLPLIFAIIFNCTSIHLPYAPHYLILWSRYSANCYDILIFFRENCSWRDAPKISVAIAIDLNWWPMDTVLFSPTCGQPLFLLRLQVSEKLDNRHLVAAVSPELMNRVRR